MRLPLDKLEVVILNAVKDPCISFGVLLNPRQRTLPKNKVKIPVLFLGPKKCASKHHVYHAFHHNFTTKTPQQNTHFLQNPSKNTHPPQNKKPPAIFTTGEA
jgi:hypothetical protein